MSTKDTDEGGRRLTPHQQQLAAKYLPMARALARPFKEQFPDCWDDFESAACLALVESARCFDPDRGVKFSTFSRRRIFGALRDERRARLARSQKSGLAEGTAARVCLMADPEAAGIAKAPHKTDREVGGEFEAVEAVEAWLRKLPRGHAAACRLIYLHEMTHAEVARELGVAPSRISYIHVEALAMLGGTWNGERPTHPGPRRRGRPRLRPVTA